MKNLYLNQPYPVIQVEKKSKEIAYYLLHIYASKDSELTALHQYAYQSMLLNDTYPKIADILLSIAKVEMHHLHLLGLTIKKLGCDPIYADKNFGQEKYWDSNNVYYDTDLKTILELDIESEQKALHEYNMLLTVIKDHYIKNLINRIILDEKNHLEIFIQLYKTNCY